MSNVCLDIHQQLPFCQHWPGHLLSFIQFFSFITQMELLHKGRRGFLPFFLHPVKITNCPERQPFSISLIKGENLTNPCFFVHKRTKENCTLNKRPQVSSEQSYPFSTQQGANISWQKDQKGEEVDRLHTPRREICRYLKVWCIATGLGGGTEASGTIWQVSDRLLGEGALDDVGVIAILLWAGGSGIHKWL